MDVVRVDPFFIERQRNQYANRGVAFIVLLNGAAAIVLLAILAQQLPSTEGLKAIADAMLVFSIGAVLGLTSALLAYLNRTFRLDQPDMTWRRPLRWLAVAAAVAGAACFLGGMNMVRITVLPETPTSSRKESLRHKSPVPQRQPNEPGRAESVPTVPHTEPEAPQTQPIEPQTMQPPTIEPQPVEPQPSQR
jgi:MFS family permease